MAAGMAKQMGDNSKPPIALTLKQTLWIMDFLDARWASMPYAEGQGSESKERLLMKKKK